MSPKIEDYSQTQLLWMIEAAILEGNYNVALSFWKGLENPSALPKQKILDQSLFALVEHDNKQGVSDLIVQKANINTKDRSDLTPLFYVRSKEMAELLIDHGADINAKAFNDKTPLLMAATASNKEVVDVLLTKGADPNAKTKDGYTPLHGAVKSKSIAIIEALLAAGADPNAKTKDGYTLLHEATKSESIAIIEALLAAGADPNIKTEGSTPLHYAVENNDYDIAKLLLTKGADPNHLNKSGKTPADYTKDPNILDLLGKHGAYISTQEPSEEVKASWTDAQRESYITARYSGKKMPEGQAGHNR
jgi:ankyrin repeat protein